MRVLAHSSKISRLYHFFLGCISKLWEIHRAEQTLQGDAMSFHVQHDGMVVDTNTAKKALRFSPKYGRTDVYLYQMTTEGLVRTPAFERFIAGAKGDYYIDAKPARHATPFAFSFAEFSDQDTAERFNNLVGGRVHRDGSHAI